MPPPDLGGLGPAVATDVDAIKVLESLVGPLDHRLLGGPDPDTRVVKLLVRLVCTLGVADLQESQLKLWALLLHSEGRGRRNFLRGRPPHLPLFTKEILPNIGSPTHRFVSSHLSLKEALVLLIEVLEPVPVGPLGVGVDVHLNHTVAHRLADFRRAGAAATVHHLDEAISKN